MTVADGTPRRDPYAYLTDPNHWSRVRAYGTDLYDRRPRVGMVVALRYSAWRVTDVRLHDETRRKLGAPYDVELQHLAGPQIDGRDRIMVEGTGHPWKILGERFAVCVCHGHPMPCQDLDRDVLTATLGAKASRELDGAQPGTCAACREPIRPRQGALTFPEPSLIVPGAPGPTFHSRRFDCWYAAYRYETELRLAAHPELTRLASCPGTGFTHMVGLRFECTAGPACTGLHGPTSRSRQGNCYSRTYYAERLSDGYKRPLSDCGYRGDRIACLGAETGPCQPSGLEGSGLFDRGDTR